MKIENGEIFISEKEIVQERKKLNQELKKGLVLLQIKYKIRSLYYNKLLSLKMALESQKNKVNNNSLENLYENNEDDRIR